MYACASIVGMVENGEKMLENIKKGARPIGSNNYVTAGLLAGQRPVT